MQTSPLPRSTLVAVFALAATLAVPQIAPAAESLEDRGPKTNDETLRAKFGHPVHALGLSGGLTSKLTGAGIFVLGDLATCQAKELRGIHGLGPAKLGKIVAALARVNLTLGMTPPDAPRTPEVEPGSVRGQSGIPNSYEAYRDQLVASVHAYADRLTPSQRRELLERHKGALVDQQPDDAALANRCFEILLTQWVAIEHRKSARELSTTIRKRDQAGQIVLGVEPATVRALERSGLYRLGVALNVEAINSHQPVGATWLQDTIATKQRVAKTHRALLGAILDQRAHLLGLGGRRDAAIQANPTIGALILWSQKSPENRAQAQGAHEILRALNLKGTGLEDVPLGLELEIDDLEIDDWWTAPEKGALDAGGEPEDAKAIDHIGANTSRKQHYERRLKRAQEFKDEIGEHRGFVFLEELAQGHTQEAIGQKKGRQMSKTSVAQVIRKLEAKVDRWHRRQSIITRAQEQVARAKTSAPRRSRRR